MSKIYNMSGKSTAACIASLVMNSKVNAIWDPVHANFPTTINSSYSSQSSIVIPVASP